MTHLEIRAELDTDINPKLSIRSEFDELQNRTGNFFFLSRRRMQYERVQDTDSKCHLTTGIFDNTKNKVGYSRKELSTKLHKIHEQQQQQQKNLE